MDKKEKVSYKIPSWAYFEIVQQVDRGFTPEVCDKLSKWSVLDQFYYICHDRDNKENVHMHFYGKVKNKTRIPTQALLNKVNKLAGCECIQFQNINKIKRENGDGWDDISAYGLHRKFPEKFQYSPDDVTANFDFEAAADRSLNRKSSIKDPVLRKYVQLIDAGTLTRYNYIDFMPIEHYVNYKSKLEKAWAYYNDRKIQEIKDGSWDIDVIYIYGNSETYKTTLAKKLCQSKDMNYCISSSQNDILQDYKGEDALILDDLRPEALNFADLMKMLDHNTRSSTSSRFYNKFLFCKLIIITSVIDIDNFYKGFKSDLEPIKQIKRRCNIYIKSSQYDFKVYQYDKKEASYIHLATFKNTLYQSYPIENLSDAEKDNTKALFNKALNTEDIKVKDIPADFMEVSDTDLPEELKNVLK